MDYNEKIRKIFNWTIYNLDFWTKDLHPEVISSPVSQLIPDLQISLAPKSEPGHWNIQIRFSSTESTGTYRGRLELLDFTSKVKAIHMINSGGCYEVVESNKFVEAMAQIAETNDSFTLRYSTPAVEPGYPGGKEHVHSILEGIDVTLEVSLNALQKLTLSGDLLASLNYRSSEGTPQRMDFLGKVDVHGKQMLFLRPKIRSRAVSVTTILCRTDDKTGTNLLRVAHVFRDDTDWFFWQALSRWDLLKEESKLRVSFKIVPEGACKVARKIEPSGLPKLSVMTASMVGVNLYRVRFTPSVPDDSHPEPAFSAVISRPQSKNALPSAAGFSMSQSNTFIPSIERISTSQSNTLIPSIDGILTSQSLNTFVQPIADIWKSQSNTLIPSILGISTSQYNTLTPPDALASPFDTVLTSLANLSMTPSTYSTFSPRLLRTLGPEIWDHFKQMKTIPTDMALVYLFCHLRSYHLSPTTKDIEDTRLELMCLIQQCDDPPDFTLVFGPMFIAIHRYMVIPQSVFFSSILEEEGQKVVTTSYDPPHDLIFALRYLYSGEMGSKLEPYLYYIATRLMIPSLRDMCAEALCSRISVSNLCVVLFLSIMNTDVRLLNSAVAFLLDNYNAVLGSPQWLALIDSYPFIPAGILTLLGRDNLVMKNESFL